MTRATTSAIPPGPRADWLDLGCGSAFAPLARPELASRIAGVDINPRAVRQAQLGAALSGLSHFTGSLGDVGDMHEATDLATCNGPMPDPGGDRDPAHGDRRCDADRLRTAMPEVWRRADPDFFARLWPALPRAGPEV